MTEPKHDRRSPFPTMTNPNPAEMMEGPLWIRWLSSWQQAADDFIESLEEEIDRKRKNYATLIAENRVEECRTTAGYELALRNMIDLVKSYKGEEMNHAKMVEKRGENKRLRPH